MLSALLVELSFEKILEKCELGLDILLVIIMIAYVFFAAVTYGCIFLVFRRQSGLRKNTQKARVKNDFNLLVHSLIIMTFVIFTIIPRGVARI